MEIDKIYLGDSLEVLKTFEDNSIDCCVTSPPYYALRSYGVEGQIGLEETPEKYIERLTDVFMEVHRVLKPNGTLWLNIGDSYAGNCSVTSTGRCGMGKPRERIVHRVLDGIKPKDLIGIPWMLAFSLRNAGWYLRQDIIWAKKSCMPESVTDRCTKSHEYIFLMSKSQKYYFDHEAIQEPANCQYIKTKPKFGGNKYGENDDKHFQTYSGKEYIPKVAKQGYALASGQRDSNGGVGNYREHGHLNSDNVYVRNKRDVWTVNPKPNKEAHYATYPQELIAPCILAGCPKDGIVLDPFMGSGTTGIVANKLGRHYVGIELNSEYIEMAERRIKQEEEQLKLF